MADVLYHRLFYQFHLPSDGGSGIKIDALVSEQIQAEKKERIMKVSKGYTRIARMSEVAIFGVLPARAAFACKNDVTRGGIPAAPDGWALVGTPCRGIGTGEKC